MSRSTDGTRHALWRREGRRIEILAVEDPGRTAAPSTWPAELMPRFEPGHISFLPYPSLEEARRVMPEYVALWEAIDADDREQLLARATAGPVAAQHAAFFDMPTHV